MIAIVALLVFSCTSVQKKDSAGSGSDRLPVDTSVQTGVFDNGMTWQICQNSEPENRLFLRLAVKAGSILEDEDQKGIAHLVEHMAFNGSEHFEKNELVDYFETIGMSFGPEVNAYTSFDETVYMLEIPSDDPEILKTSLLVLQDWASGLTFDAEELDKERGVVIEEWRMGRGAGGRIMDAQVPFLFGGSRYAERLPIGDPEIVKTVSRDRVIDFYTKWYRPDLMTVTLVGDADPSVLLSGLSNTLGKIPAVKKPPKRNWYESKIQKKSSTLVFRDPEIPYTTIQILEQFPVSTLLTEKDLRSQLVRSIGFYAFNERMSEKILAGSPTLLAAQAGDQRIVKPTMFSFVGVVPAPGAFVPAMKDALEELSRLEQFGVTAEELERAQQSILDSVKQEWLNKDKVHSASIAGALVNQDIYGDVALSIQDKYDLYNRIVLEITREQVTSSINDWYTGRGKLLMITAPEAADDIPSDAELLNLWQNWKPETSLVAYEEKGLQRPLFDTSSLVAPGAIVSEKEIAKEGIKEWILSNGARVLVYPTSYKSNEILFSAWSRGGVSLVSDADFPSAVVSTSFATMSGLNGFSAVELQKKLSGKTVSLGLWLDEAYEGFSGASSVEEFETLFQLISLYFTNAQFSPEAWTAVRNQLETVSASRKNDPGEMFADLKVRLVYGDSVRRSTLTESFVASMNPTLSEASFRNRFADAGDFTFVFVGSVDETVLKQFATQYLAVLPSSGIKEKAQDVGIEFPAGIVSDALSMGLEPKSQVFLSFGGNTDIGNWDYELFNSFISLLETRLREVIREDLSGSYGVSVRGSLVSEPKPVYELVIEFGCEPGREEILTKAVFEQISWFQNDIVPEKYIGKLKENWKRNQEEGLKNNNWWLDQIVTKEMQNLSLETISDTKSYLKELSGVAMQNLAKEYLKQDNYVKATLMPQKK